MTKPKVNPKREMPEHFYRYLGNMRQWIDGFEAAGGKGPANKDVLRQLQVWIAEYNREP